MLQVSVLATLKGLVQAAARVAGERDSLERQLEALRLAQGSCPVTMGMLRTQLKAARHATDLARQELQESRREVQAAAGRLEAPLLAVSAGRSSKGGRPQQQRS
jgi:hypothetical protein